MKKEKQFNSFYIPFSKMIFAGLMLLGIVLIVFSISDLGKNSYDNFSNEDFENELMGQAYFAALHKNHQAEIMLYNKVLARLPELAPELNYNIGLAHYAENNLVEAMKFMGQSLELEYADSNAVFFHVAQIAQKSKNYAMAEKYYLQLIDNAQFAKAANFNLGNIYFFQKKDEKKGLEHYQNALEDLSINHAYKQMLWREQKVYSKRKNSDLYNFLETELSSEKEEKFFSRFDISEFAKVMPDKTQSIVHNYLGINYAKNQNNFEAMRHFKRAIKIDPDYKDAKHNLQKIFTTTNIPENIKNHE